MRWQPAGECGRISTARRTSAPPRLSLGTHVITATYSGDESYLASTAAPLNQVVESATTCLSHRRYGLLLRAVHSHDGQAGELYCCHSSGTAPITYTWNFGYGADVITTTTSVVHSFPLTNTAQTYTVTLAAANAVQHQAAAPKLVTVQPVRVYLPLIWK